MNSYIKQDLPQLRHVSKILDTPLTFVDLETTGMVYDRNFSIIEIGLIHITENKIIERSSLLNPETYIPQQITEITGITNEMVKGQKTFNLFAPYMDKVARHHILCGFNSKTFDSKGLEKMLQKHKIFTKYSHQLDFKFINFKSRRNLHGYSSQKGTLTEVSKEYGVRLSGNAHRAGYDIALTALIAEKILELNGVGILHKYVNDFDSRIKNNYINHIIKNNIAPI